jgi:hypothetical protein
MAPYVRIYSDELQAALKKGQGFKDELIDEIKRVLLNDPDLQELVLSHPDIQELMRDRTFEKYQELVERSK